MAVTVAGHELCLCECDGAYYAVSRACGHQRVPLDRGALHGWVLTCPLHHVRFDIRNGHHLSDPASGYLGAEPLPEAAERYVRLEQRLMRETPTHDLVTYQVRVVGGSIEVELHVVSETDPKT